MKILSLSFSALILLGYAALMRIDTAWGLLYPRGGMIMLGISLAIANAAIWVACQSHRSLSARFQLAAAGWIWLVVQAGGTAYVYAHSGAA